MHSTRWRFAHSSPGVLAPRELVLLLAGQQRAVADLAHVGAQQVDVVGPPCLELLGGVRVELVLDGLIEQTRSGWSLRGGLLLVDDEGEMRSRGLALGCLLDSFGNTHVRGTPALPGASLCSASARAGQNLSVRG